MSLDAGSLRAFYNSPLGHVVRRQVGQRIRHRWQNISGLTVAGVGFTYPYLTTLRRDAERVACLMPARQGAVVWPSSHPCLTALVEEHHWPLKDSSVDRLIAIHCLEQAEQTAPVLREAWRVLAPNGRLMLIVPNRAGLWSRFDSTPFGHGLPFSRSQLEAQLNEALLTPLDWNGALYFPPIDNRVALRMAPALERVGARIPSGVAGVIVVEASKDLIAPVVTGRRSRKSLVPSPVLVPSPIRRSPRSALAA